MTDKLKPGMPAPKSGQYKEVGPRGGFVSNTEITAVQGKPMPPTDKSGNSYVLVDSTKHKK
ncbi:YjzC family protein [bacterium]|nr:YjzC family protein [bacterium]